MHRFYSPQSNFSNQQIILDDIEEIHHLRYVLRLKPGSIIEVFDGKGTHAQAKIENIQAKSVECSIESVTKQEVLKPSIVLACAIPKKTKFEWIIEKCVELGVSEIIPMLTERTIVDIEKGKVDKKRERFETIALNALKQSQQNFLPMVQSPQSFKNVLKDLQARTTIIMPSLVKNTKPLLTVLSTMDISKPVSIMIGPEGDFTENEYQIAHSSGAIPVSLGSTILKVETAAIATVACAHLNLHN